MYDGPDVPSTDLPEDITGPEPQTVPLDVSTLHKVPGYETVGYYADGEWSRSIIGSFQVGRRTLSLQGHPPLFQGQTTELQICIEERLCQPSAAIITLYSIHLLQG